MQAGGPKDGLTHTLKRAVPEQTVGPGPFLKFAPVTHSAHHGPIAMKISVVVPAFNEEKLIGQSLGAIRKACAAFEGRGWQWEMIVCDNNSTDRTAAIAKAEGAEVVFEPVNQISRARNRGASVATGDWLVFVDADSFPGAALFARVADRIATGKCAGGGCLVRLDERVFAMGIFVGGWNLVSRLMRWAAGSFVFCDAKLFHELGGFSEKMYASEEIDLSKRLKRLAKQRGLSVEIITEERLVTSARKVRLYGRREHLRFLFKAMLAPRRTVMNRDRCVLWYDGRR
jgi:glycosyltransferase involved in cell wall biosynthesis